jgi:hypothetical protein
VKTVANRLTHLLLVYHYTTSNGISGWGNCEYGTASSIPLPMAEIRNAEAFIKKTMPNCKNAVLTNYFILGQGAQ